MVSVSCVSSLHDGGTCWLRCVKVVEWLVLTAGSPVSGGCWLGGRVWQRPLALVFRSEAGGPARLLEANSLLKGGLERVFGAFSDCSDRDGSRERDFHANLLSDGGCGGGFDVLWDSSSIEGGCERGLETLRASSASEGGLDGGREGGSLDVLASSASA